MFALTAQLIAELEAIDTPTVCNALEVVAPERRGYGYTTEHLFCIRPELKSRVGIARTARIRSAQPSGLSASAAQNLSDDYYRYVDNGPKPSVIVIQDIDAQKGYGSFWGEVNSSIHLGLGCRAVITDGGVRDLPDLAPDFQVLAGRIIPSHAFDHVVDFGHEVTVAGMRVKHGDLVHFDQHGAVIVPPEAVSRLSTAALKIREREQKIVRAARRPGFTAEILRKLESDETDLH